MLPPATTGTKRKTLADRAGEPRRAPQAPSINATTIAGTKPSSWGGNYRQPSVSSSIASSRPLSVASSRNISGGSCTSTMSTTSRPPSAQANRPQSAMAASRIQRPQSTHGRSASSLNASVAQPGAGRAQGQRSGRTLFPSTLTNCPESLEIGKTRGSHDTQTQSISEWASSKIASGSSRIFLLPTTMNGSATEPSRLPSSPSIAQKRDTSITTAMGNLCLSSHKPYPFASSCNLIVSSSMTSQLDQQDSIR